MLQFFMLAAALAAPQSDVQSPTEVSAQEAAPAATPSQADAAVVAAEEQEQADADSEQQGSAVRIDFNGYADFEAEWNASEPKRVDFDPHHFSLYSTANILDSARAFVELEMEHGAEFEGGGGEVETALGAIKAERMWIEGFVNERLNIRAGKMLTAYGFWPEWHTPVQRESTLRPLLHDKGPFPKDLTGIAAYGMFFVGSMNLGYHVGVYNGPGGSNPNEKDGNFDKATTLRLKLDAPVLGLSTALSGYRGVNADSGRLEMVGDFMLVYHAALLQVTIEGAYGRSQDADDSSNPTDVAAAYVEVDVKVTDTITPMVRFDYNDRDLDHKTAGSKDEGVRLVAGVNYHVNQFAVLRGEVVWHRFEAPDVDGNDAHQMAILGAAVNF